MTRVEQAMVAKTTASDDKPTPVRKPRRRRTTKPKATEQESE